jgi:integrase
VVPLSAGFAAHAIHFQLGLVTDGPKQTRPNAKLIRPTVSPAIEDAVGRWLQYDADRGTPEKTQANNSLHLRYFLTFLAERVPELRDLSELNRAHVLDFLGWLAERTQVSDSTKPLSHSTRSSTLSTVQNMLRELHENEMAPAPGHALVHRGDYPRTPKRLPRFLPTQMLHEIMEAIEALDDPYQRCALLVARWSGARRDEINRLELDCLDTYADGTYRLRIPAGKTGKERSVPLHDIAAEALQEVQKLRALDRDGGTIDRVTKQRVRYLFMSRGRHLSKAFLFDLPLQRACEQAGLLTVEGGKLVTAHRFRHTLGTQLVEAGARWRTIMSILGHETADMTMTYAHVSDPEVKADYEKVVQQGVAIAGPAAERIKNNELTQAELDWLQTSFYKSEMELGGCLRLPEEGPCECDLFLLCGKFFTTEEHAPRLRRRWHREQQLVDDARERGWAREVERHTAIQRRLEALLADLGQTLEGPDADC